MKTLLEVEPRIPVEWRPGSASAIDFPSEQHSIAIRNGSINGWGVRAIRGWYCKDCQVRPILATDNSVGGTTP
jgi:hypothetical protein